MSAAENVSIDKPSFAYINPASLAPKYAMRIDGGCMLPLFEHGSLVEIHRDAVVQPGDIVCIFACPGTRLLGYGGPAIIKQAIMLPPKTMRLPYITNHGSNAVPLVVVASLVPAKRFAIPCDQIAGIHKVVGPIAEEYCYKTGAA